MSELVNVYVIVGPVGIAYVGLHKDPMDAWKVYLGWPSDKDILDHTDAGWYCTKAKITWQRPPKPI